MFTSETSTTTHITAGGRGAVLAELHQATKRFGRGAATVEAVRGVDLAVRAGELLAVLGPNGAGKTTAISMLTGLPPADQRCGAAVRSGPPRHRRPATGRGHAAGLGRAGDTPRARTAERVPRLLPRPAPAERGDRRGGPGRAGAAAVRRAVRRASSAGCCSAIALCGNPELLFFDEPTTGLDAEVRRGLWATLRELTASGRGVVLTTHYLEEADALADRVVVLDRGRVIAEGRRPRSSRWSRAGGSRAQTLGDRGRGAAVARRAAALARRRVAGAAGRAPPSRSCAQLMARDPAVSDLTVAETSLEEAFLTLTDHEGGSSMTGLTTIPTDRRPPPAADPARCGCTAPRRVTSSSS